MRRTADNGHVFQRNLEFRLHVIANQLHGLRYDTLDGQDDFLLVQLASVQGLQSLVQIRGWSNFDDIIGLGNHGFYVSVNLDFFRVDEHGA